MLKIVDEQMREATRRRIMREAASEFARLGFDQANINMIAEQSGIGKGTIYLYFERNATCSSRCCVRSRRSSWRLFGWRLLLRGRSVSAWNDCLAPLLTLQQKRATASMCT